MIIGEAWNDAVKFSAGALFLLALLLGAGCGGGDATTESVTPSREVANRYPALIPRAAFVKRARAICLRSMEERNRRLGVFYEKRAEETGEGFGAVGTVEFIPEVIVPSLRRQLEELKEVGLPRGEVVEAEMLWQAFAMVLHEVEADGIYAWGRRDVVVPFRTRAQPFGLQKCIINSPKQL